MAWPTMANSPSVCRVWQRITPKRLVARTYNKYWSIPEDLYFNLVPNLAYKRPIWAEKPQVKKSASWDPDGARRLSKHNHCRWRFAEPGGPFEVLKWAFLGDLCNIRSRWLNSWVLTPIDTRSCDRFVQGRWETFPRQSSREVWYFYTRCHYYACC